MGSSKDPSNDKRKELARSGRKKKKKKKEGDVLRCVLSGEAQTRYIFPTKSQPGGLEWPRGSRMHRV